MLAVRELNVERLPESSRNWINERLIYTHGYGITMNPVNGFTPEGLPDLILSNMPVQSTNPGIQVTRPEIYFGELTNTDVYVNTRQKEFNYPQGDTNSVTSYEGKGGVVLGGFFRRLLIALDRGDLTRLPFSDDITPDSRLLMRRNIRERVDLDCPVPDARSRSVHRARQRRAAGLGDGCLHDIRFLPVRAALSPRQPGHQLHAQQRQGDRRCLRRDRRLLYVRRRRSGDRGVPGGVSDAVQGRTRDARRPARAHALPGADASDAGDRLRAVSHLRPGRLLQPRGCLERGGRSELQRRGASRLRR